MDGNFFTMQDFMTHTKGIIYLLMLAILASYVGYWLFISGRDDDDSAGNTPHHH